MASTSKTKLPQLRLVHGLPPQLQDFLQAVKEKLEVYEGQRGDPLDAFLTLREFYERIEQDGEVVLRITAATDHGGLLGLMDDDHKHYHNDARALTWLNSRSTDDLPEGSTNKYFSGKTQDDLPDGSTYKQYDPTNVNITGGAINGITDLAIADGGTGASDAASARANLGVPSADEVLKKDGSVSITADWDIDGQQTLYIDRTNKRVDISNSSPNYALEVSGESMFNDEVTDDSNILAILKNTISIENDGTYSNASLSVKAHEEITDSAVTNNDYLAGIILESFAGATNAFEGELDEVYGLISYAGMYNSSSTGKINSTYCLYTKPYMNNGDFGNIYGLYLAEHIGTPNSYTALYGIYQEDTDAKNYFAGDVGIGVDPTHILHIEQNSATDPIADDWTKYCLGKYKEIINEVTDFKDILDEFKTIPVHKWKPRLDEPKPEIFGSEEQYQIALQQYKKKVNLPKFAKAKYSMIAEDAPEFVQAHDENGNVTGISIFNYIGYLHVVIRGLLERIEKIESTIPEVIESN